ncbi:MAG: RIP metalloprotease RseP [Candidatus Pacebacteria bacterium]|nr:RIP metalloprotease RseP [Candidatus Paceibacterota bacterium]
MLITLATIVVVLFFLGLCIFVHELGHLLVALWCGLHVERFSLGFGKKIWGFWHNKVEYIVSMLPFGGYVALPQLDPTDEPVDRDGNRLPQARPMARILTAFSGPFSNIAFGFLLGSLVFWAGVYRPAPRDEYVVHSVEESSPEYAAGLRAGDRIVKVNGKPVTDGWGQLVQTIALSKGKVDLLVESDGQREQITYKPAPNPKYEGLGYPLFEIRTPTVVQRVQKNMPAAQAGIQTGDRILSVNGTPVASPYAFMKTMWESEGEPLTITLQRDGETYTVHDIRGVPREADGETYHIIGAVVDEPKILKHMSPWAQFVNVVTTTRDTLASLVSPKSLVKPRHMSGPVGIVQVNYLMIRHGGWRQGLFFVVFVSFSLALINLLPIPVLDGGHILFAVLELASGRRVPTRVAHAIQLAFAALIISFMLYITFFDIKRVSGRLFPGDGGNSTEEMSDGKD